MGEQFDGIARRVVDDVRNEIVTAGSAAGVGGHHRVDQHRSLEPVYRNLLSGGGGDQPVIE